MKLVVGVCRIHGCYLARFGFVLQFDSIGGFLRLWDQGPGVSWTSMKPLFSERIGKRRPFTQFGRYRFFWLGRSC